MRAWRLMAACVCDRSARRLSVAAMRDFSLPHSMRSEAIWFVTEASMSLCIALSCCVTSANALLAVPAFSRRCSRLAMVPLYVATAFCSPMLFVISVAAAIGRSAFLSAASCDATASVAFISVSMPTSDCVSAAFCASSWL